MKFLNSNLPGDHPAPPTPRAAASQNECSLKRDKVLADISLWRTPSKSCTCPVSFPRPPVTKETRYYGNTGRRERGIQSLTCSRCLPSPGIEAAARAERSRPSASRRGGRGNPHRGHWPSECPVPQPEDWGSGDAFPRPQGPAHSRTYHLMPKLPAAKDTEAYSNDCAGPAQPWTGCNCGARQNRRVESAAGFCPAFRPPTCCSGSALTTRPCLRISDALPRGLSVAAPPRRPAFLPASVHPSPMASLLRPAAHLSLSGRSGFNTESQALPPAPREGDLTVDRSDG